MPELPEVETIRKGLQGHLENHIFKKVIIRQARLRWPIDANLPSTLKNQTLLSLQRRGKYLLFLCEKGTLIIHLGMSGSLHLLNQAKLPSKHDHVDILFSNDRTLRYHDPRRFGAILWSSENTISHPLFKNLGPEPLKKDFNGNYLYGMAQKSKLPSKQFLMDNRIVVGIGNIYANEILFQTKLSPLRPINTLDKKQCEQLAQVAKKILQKAIIKGGTTLKDFCDSEGKPGYFQQDLKVYGRKDLPCYECGNTLHTLKQAQRTTTYCIYCQI